MGELLVRGAALAEATGAGVVTPAGGASWGEVLAGAERVADELAGHGLGRGSRVGLLVDNSVSGLRALFGVLLLGAVAVPVNTRFAAPEVRHVLDDARVTAVLLTDHAESPDGFPALLHRAARGRRSWGLTGVLVGSEGAVGPDAAGLTPVPCTPAAEPAAVAARVAAARHRVDVRDPALVVHTSGTTARPKGCPLSHGALVGVARAVGRDRFRCTADDVLWDVLPLFHLSFVLPVLAVLDAGGGFVTDRRFDPVRALAQIRDTSVTVAFTCFPTVIDALLERPDFGAVFAGVRLMLNVGPPATLAAIQRRAPGTVAITSYGSSEVGGIAATTAPDDPDEIRLGTNGRPLRGTEIGVVDPAGEQWVPDGERGEIVVRGAALAEGYENDPGATARSRTSGGWFRTGDLGSMGPGGRIRYHGRFKEMIKVGGENVAALEVEAVLAAHPAVVTAAVVAVPDRRLTEVPAAFVELRAPVEAEELLAHCRAALAAFKLPRHVRVVTEWPMSATKIRKSVLVERLVAELGLRG